MNLVPLQTHSVNGPALAGLFDGKKPFSAALFNSLEIPIIPPHQSLTAPLKAPEKAEIVMMSTGKHPKDTTHSAITLNSSHGN